MKNILASEIRACKTLMIFSCGNRNHTSLTEVLQKQHEILTMRRYIKGGSKNFRHTGCDPSPELEVSEGLLNQFK